MTGLGTYSATNPDRAIMRAPARMGFDKTHGEMGTLVPDGGPVVWSLTAIARDDKYGGCRDSFLRLSGGKAAVDR